MEMPEEETEDAMEMPEEEMEDASFIYEPHTLWHYANEEYEPNPNPNDVEAKVLTPFELCNNAFVLRNYCTNRQAIEEHEKYKKAMEEEAKLKPPGESKSQPEMIEWVADDLYGSVVGQKGPVGPNPVEVDPSLLQRDREPIVLTPEEEYYYGPMEPTNPPPVPKPGPPVISYTSESSSKGGNFTKYPRQSMAEMSLNDAPQGPHGGLVFTSLSVEEDRDKHPMEDPQIMSFYEEDFRLIPGDVIIFTKPSLEAQLYHEPSSLRCLVSIYQDSHYFQDHGQFRVNFLDKHPLEEGDLVVRFGNFNKYWLWNRHPTINFYMYWPGLKPPSCSNKKLLHPWYWIDHGLVQYGGVLGVTLPISLPTAPTHMPIGMKVPNFQLRNGDVLIHYNKMSNVAPPFDHKLECRVWNPMLANTGEEGFVYPHDRVLRHGMNFQFYGNRYDGVCTTVAHAELYFCDEHRDWRYLGGYTARFSDHIKREPSILPLGLVPLAGDIMIDRKPRGRSSDCWDGELNVGGLVSFHTCEFFKEYGREARPFVWFRDAGKYGVGNVTMVLRLGSFQDEREEWTWHEGKYAQLFILNTRGSSWRLNSTEKWPLSLLRPKPNYHWKPYNPMNLHEVSPDFQPQYGDILVRLSFDTLERRLKKHNPVYVGSSFNPHYEIKVEMAIIGPRTQVQKGDFLIRAGYERNKINPSWTNATVELYFYEKYDADESLKWSFKGRDMYIYGTKYTIDGLKDVHKSGFGDFRVSDISTINSRPDRPKFGADC